MSSTKFLTIGLFSLLSLGGCGVENQDSTVAALSPNLVASAPNFRCGDGVVVIVVRNIGQAPARSSFFRVDQSNQSSTAVAVKALQVNESDRKAITVRYKDGKMEANITVDANRNVAESHENDNLLRLVCR